MRVLLDENIDRRLKPLFDPAFQVVTVLERGWDGLRNGELLRAARAEFDALLTMDRNLHTSRTSAVSTSAWSSSGPPATVGEKLPR